MQFLSSIVKLVQTLNFSLWCLSLLVSLPSSECWYIDIACLLQTMTDLPFVAFSTASFLGRSK